MQRSPSYHKCMGGNISRPTHVLLVGVSGDLADMVERKAGEAGLVATTVESATDATSWMAQLRGTNGSAEPPGLVAVGESLGPEELTVIAELVHQLRPAPHVWLLGDAAVSATALRWALSVQKLQAAPDHPALMRGLARALVGTMSWKDIQRMLRIEVVREALQRAQGSRRSAARILGLSRTAVQRIIRQDHVERPCPKGRASEPPTPVRP